MMIALNVRARKGESMEAFERGRSMDLMSRLTKYFLHRVLHGFRGLGFQNSGSFSFSLDCRGYTGGQHILPPAHRGKIKGIMDVFQKREF